MFVSMSTFTEKYNKGIEDQWGNFGALTYVLLKKGTDPKALEKKFPAFMQRKNGTEMKQLKIGYTLFLEPIRDVYLYSKRNGVEKGSATNVYTFSIIALFILLIACINFVNLSTARSVERAKEVLGFETKTSLQEGIRKTIEWYSQNTGIARRRGKELHG